MVRWWAVQDIFIRMELSHISQITYVNVCCVLFNVC